MDVGGSCLVSLAGCGKGNDKFANDVIGALDGLSTAISTGDKAQLKAAMDKLKSVANEYKTLKISQSEMKRLEPKFKDAGERLKVAMINASSERKITAQEVMDVSTLLMSFQSK